MSIKRYDGIIRELKYYSDKTKDGRYVIPVSVDWDYTLTKCSSWEDGSMIINEEAFPIMRRWIEEYNVGFILSTMRHDAILEEPLAILKDRGIELYGVRKNPIQDADGNVVPKCFSVFDIDDRDCGIPTLMHEGCDRPYVDWKRVDEIMTPILQEISEGLKKT